MLTLDFNNTNSYNKFNLIMEKKPNIPMPEEDIEFIKIEGRHGSLTVNRKGYKDISIPVEFGLIDNTGDIFTRSSYIRSWLTGSGILFFSHIPNIIFKVKAIKSSNIEMSLKKFGRFSVNFICEPFKYGNEIIRTITTSNNSFNYSGTAEVKPLINVYGQGDITLTVNNENIILEQIADYITIDGLLEDAYKDIMLQNNKMHGEFPILKPGENIIDFIGNVTKIEITYREAFL
ncbi:distal tail protein Dit [Clostridium tunisiense]|uniref:distal tail protein Dit n=1 Tax=Clostridium tunisiense TaxID=219748 RepID=UPI00031130E2|nr:distal tail protein Dit [Clostridium tunisiense]